MKSFKILCLMVCILTFSSNASAEYCFIASENNKIIHHEGQCDRRYTPASTFKIAISLMGFDSGILIDEMHPRWGFKLGYADSLDSWKQPHNPKLWIMNSCVWYSQIITKKLGVEKFEKYINMFNYGNHNTLGDKGMNNGLTNSWLSSSLAISPKEQIAFLNKLVTNTLPVSLDAQEKTKKIIYQETLSGGWDLYAKTGSGLQLDADGNKVKDRQVGWFVGFIHKGRKIITFACLIADEHKQKSYTSIRAKEYLKKGIIKIIANNSITLENRHGY